MFAQHFQGVKHRQTVTVITGAVIGKNTAYALAFFASFQIVRAAEKVSCGTADIADDALEIGLFTDSVGFLFIEH